MHILGGTLVVPAALLLIALHGTRAVHAGEASTAEGPTVETSPAADGAAEPSTPPEEYGLGVRSTPWRTPAEQRTGFHLPDGFEIRLVASEPEIAKPLNMAFDQHGRMWLTHTVAYPYPSAPGEHERDDAVVILSDEDGDGHADRVQRFAEHLNIPIGVLPYGDGCLCFSIPNIWYLRDTNGDGRCDRREVVLGPFDTSRDAHGLVNSLRDGGDGWIYACHGFNNQSHVAGDDGHTVDLISGNTFRFRPDGSRVELVTRGQVNPFGMTEDHWGYRYSADCHSKPISQLIRGACYPSFGRPHDGLGFLPPTVDHLHGSTAISGIAYIPPDSNMKPLRGQFLSGNVMTSRLNRNALTFHGATARGIQLDDFLTSDDPWFRPADVRLGPDGHLYVADFYNRIIGHYEVDLEHPGRDRTSGRIWQIRYRGSDGDEAGDVATSDNLPVLPADHRLDPLEDPAQNQPIRLAATRCLVAAGDFSPKAIVSLVDQSDARIRVEALRLATETPYSEQVQSAALSALHDQNPHVALAAAQWLGDRGNPQLDPQPIEALMERLAGVPGDDPVLRQGIRIAVRDILVRCSSDAPVWQRPVTPAFASILLGLNRPEVSGLLVRYLASHPDAEGRLQLLRHAVSNAAASADAATQLAACIALARDISRDDEGLAFELLDTIEATVSPHGDSDPQTTTAWHSLRQWATELIGTQLTRVEEALVEGHLIAWSTSDEAPWPVEPRRLGTPEGGTAPFRSSFGRGEPYVGTLSSAPFVPPAEIRFWVAGHDGRPGLPPQQNNCVRLVEVASGNTIAEQPAPRSDIAQLIRWDTAEHQQRRVRIECVDGDSGQAYAWIAIGPLEPAWINGTETQSFFWQAADWIERLKLSSFRPRLERLIRHDELPRTHHFQVAEILAGVPDEYGRIARPEAKVILELLAEHGNESLDQQVWAAKPIDAWLQQDGAKLLDAARILIRHLSGQQQRAFALNWASSGAEASSLLTLCREGDLSVVAFADADVKQLVWPRLSDAQRAQAEQLVSRIDVDGQRREQLAALQASIRWQYGDHAAGQQLYQKHCAACHQLRGSGTVLGPQLDGAVPRSTARLLEDILAPDQNVDAAFRTTRFLLNDGRVIVGLVRAETADEISIVDAAGEVQRLDPTTIELRQLSARSLMPGNFHEVLTDAEITNLLSFIKQQ